MISGKLRASMTTAAVLLLAIPAAGLAAPPNQSDDRAVTVSYADLDINSEAGAKVLYARLKRASEDVCGVAPYLESGSLTKTRKAKLCYAETLGSAVDSIDSDLLTSIHKS